MRQQQSVAARVVVALCVTSVVGGLGFAHAGALNIGTPSLSPPSVVRVTPTIGGVNVTWHATAPSGVGYVVTTTAGHTVCVELGPTHCFVRVATLGSWSFQVVSVRGKIISAPSPPTRPLMAHLVIWLAGQSNAEGAGSLVASAQTGVDAMAPGLKNQADAHDSIVWEPWYVLPATRSASPAQVPLDTPQRATDLAGTPAIFGPEIGLARTLAATVQAPVTIVKTAYPGSSLAFDWNPRLKLNLLTPALKLVTTTLSGDASRGQLDILGLFVFFQGEADVLHLSMATNYQANLRALVSSIRTALPFGKALPMVLVKESSSIWISLTCSSNCDVLSQSDKLVRAADDAVASSVSQISEVDSFGIERDSSDVHLDNVGELAIGATIATTALQLLPIAH